MNGKDTTAKETILQATIALLEEGIDPGKLTIRTIAERAEVGIGSINYHFQSKDNLLNEAVSSLLMGEAARWFQPNDEAEASPVDRLRTLLKSTSRIGMRYPKLLQTMVSYDLLQGELNTVMLIVPLLREIFGDTKSEKAIRLAAMQVLVTIQVMFLRAPLVRLYASIDITNDQERDEAIDILINNLIHDKGNLS